MGAVHMINKCTTFKGDVFLATYKELRKKEVICIKDCRRLGHVCDLEIDECKGCICKIIVPGCRGFWSMLTDDSVIAIPYSCIRQIGPDLILVDI